MSKVFMIPVVPGKPRGPNGRKGDDRYIEGQRLLVEAMKYLAQSNKDGNRSAIDLLSEHVRTKFRMTDSPLG